MIGVGNIEQDMKHRADLAQLGFVSSGLAGLSANLTEIHSEHVIESTNTAEESAPASEPTTPQPASTNTAEESAPASEPTTPQPASTNTAEESAPASEPTTPQPASTNTAEESAPASEPTTPQPASTNTAEESAPASEPTTPQPASTDTGKAKKPKTTRTVRTRKTVSSKTTKKSTRTKRARSATSKKKSKTATDSDTPDTLEEELAQQLTPEEIESFQIEKVDMERLIHKVCDILLQSESDGMFQSDLYKKLKLGARNGARLSLKLERMGIVTRIKLVEKERWTYKLILKKTPVSTASLEDAPCLICPKEQLCTLDGEISPRTCSYIEDWVTIDMVRKSK